MKIISIFTPRQVLKLFSFWPPFAVSGIRMISVSDDLRFVEVQKTTSFWNQNYFGTHFGGSLYDMCDPFYVFMLLHNLGKDYIIWDKGASIEYLKATNRPVKAKFKLDQQKIDEVKKAADENFKVEPTFEIDVADDLGQVVARVTKILYVRRKDAKERFKEA